MRGGDTLPEENLTPQTTSTFAKLKRGDFREITRKRKKHFYTGPTMSRNLHLLILQVHQCGHRLTTPGCNT